MIEGIIGVIIFFGGLSIAFYWVENLYSIKWWQKKLNAKDINHHRLCSYLNKLYEQKMIDKEPNLYGVVCYVPKDEEQTIETLQNIILAYRIKTEIQKKERIKK